MNDPMKPICSPDVWPRLEKAITELLNAGWNTAQIRDALSKQQSFGKHDGCTPLAIKALADKMCGAINTANRAADREILRQATASLREEFPDITKYFRR
jgi:hypothetical protein